MALFETLTAGDTTLTGTLEAPRLLTKTLVFTGSGGITLDASYYGKTTFVSGDYAPVVTLPANGAPAGTTMRFVMIGTNTCAPVFTAATADTLITYNDQAADSIAFATANRIGAEITFLSTGTYWVALSNTAVAAATTIVT
jgi:hypothetical protein